MRFNKEKLREIRERQRISQDELGRLIGRAGSTISQYERGDFKPDLFMLYKIAYVLDYPMEDFIECPPGELPDIFEVA